MQLPDKPEWNLCDNEPPSGYFEKLKGSFVETEIGKLCIQRIQVTEAAAVEINTSATFPIQSMSPGRNWTSSKDNQPWFIDLLTVMFYQHIFQHIKVIQVVNCNHQQQQQQRH